MKFIVSSTQLLKQLQVLGGVINNNNTLPILDNFLFDLSQNQLIISASDLETTMSTTIDVEADEPGSIAVPARLLLDTLKTFPEQPASPPETSKPGSNKPKNTTAVRFTTNFIKTSNCLIMPHIIARVRRARQNPLMVLMAD